MQNAEKLYDRLAYRKLNPRNAEHFSPLLCIITYYLLLRKIEGTCSLTLNNYAGI